MGVWEEALIEELFYLIGHLAHTEQHLVEMDGILGTPFFMDDVYEVRIMRKDVGKILFDTMCVTENSKNDKNKKEFRSGIENLWCTIKHLSMALIHCDECIEKLERRYKEQSDIEILENIKMLLKIREKIRNLLMKMQYYGEIGQLENVENLRCREDLCLENQEK